METIRIAVRTLVEFTLHGTDIRPMGSVADMQEGIFQPGITTKGEGHGFGLVRIDSIVERLNGYLSRNSEDGAFTTEILLPQS